MNKVTIRVARIGVNLWVWSLAMPGITLAQGMTQTMRDGIAVSHDLIDRALPSRSVPKYYKHRGKATFVFKV